MKIKIEHLLANSAFVCFLFLMLGGFISSLLQYEALWDFVNYHYYNAWAFVNNRFNQDVLMAGINGFFNPLPDLPLYFLIEFFNPYPALISFVQGLWFGALLYVVYLLALLFFDKASFNGKLDIALCLLVAATGCGTFLQIGTASNEVMLAFLELTAIYLLVHEIFYIKSGSFKPFAWAGFLLGAAMGLKLTGVLYCVVSGITLILFYKKIKNPWQNIVCFAFLGILGFFLLSGWWMWRLWIEVENPIFPFANDFFESPWISASNFYDQNFVPRNWLEFLFWPFIISFSLYRDEGSMFIVDFRLFFAYLILFYFAAKIICLAMRHQKIEIDGKWLFLSVYLLLTYLVWAYFFSISRYFIVGEVLLAVLLVKCLFSKRPTSVWGQGIYYSFFVFCLFVLFSTPYFSYNWGYHKDWAKDNEGQDAYIGVEKINIPDNALIQTYNYPTSLFFAYWANQNPSISGVNVFQQVNSASFPDGSVQDDYFESNPAWQKKREEKIAHHTGPKLLLVANGFDGIRLNMNFSKLKEAKGMRCYFLKNNLLPFISLCAPKEIADQVFINKKYKIYEDEN